MRGVNKVIIIGTLGADPEVKQFSNGGSIANISVATSEQWTDKQSGEKREATEWHRVSLANRLGEIAAQYLRKGSKVYIEGKLSTRKYEKDGQDRYVTEIKAFSMQMLDSANGGQQNQQQSNQGYQQPSNNQGYNNQQAHQQNQQSYQQQPQQGFNNQMSQAPRQTMDNAVVDEQIPF